MEANISIYHQWAEAMREDFANAKKTILLSALSLHWSAQHKESSHGLWCAELAAAVRRGVGVMMVLPTPSRIHSATLQNGTHAQRAAVHGVRFRWVDTAHLLHTKSAVIDTEVLWVGSGNFTTAAMQYNHETYMRAASTKLGTHHAQHLLTISRGEG